MTTTSNTETATMNLTDITDLTDTELDALLDSAAARGLDELIVDDVATEGTTTIDRLEDLFSELDDDFFARIDALVAAGRITRRGRRILAA